MNRDPVEMTDKQLAKAHKLALKKQREWTEAVWVLEWHLAVRKHIVKQAKINRIDDMKSAIAKLEKEVAEAA